MSNPKICVIGAGSAVFMRSIVGDALLRPEFKTCALALHDIDAARLGEAERVARKTAADCDSRPDILATVDRRRALEGADFVVTMFQAGGYEPATALDFEIPKKYGLRQTIGDTIGIGGIMRALRTAPVLLDIAADMRELCPEALMLQHANPMAMSCMALRRLAPDIRAVGLCHSVRHTIGELARDLGENPADIRYGCAGINHMAFFDPLVVLRADGREEDLRPRLRELARSRRYGRNMDDCANHARYDAFMRLGYFVTESSEHFSEYVPWFIKPHRPELLARHDIPLDEYPRRCRKQAAEWNARLRELESEGKAEVTPSGEYAAEIMAALVSGEPTEFYGNVPNDGGLISNLPRAACVEVLCVADANGIAPRAAGEIPVQLAALMRTNINPQTLTVEALATGRCDHVHHAALLDPLTAAVLPPDEIAEMVEELLAAHAEWIPVLA